MTGNDATTQRKLKDAAAQRNWLRKRYAERMLINGRLVAPLPAGRHGRMVTYVKHGCRCDLCRDVAARSRAAYRRKRQS